MSRISHLIDISLDNLAERIGAPTDHRRNSAIARHFKLKTDRVRAWVARGRISNTGFRIIERAGHPRAKWLAFSSERETEMPQSVKGEGPSSKARFPDTPEGWIREGQSDNETKPLSSAIEDLTEIFESGDPYLIPLIHSNLVAAKQAVQAHKRLKDLEEAHKKIKELEKAYAILSNEVNTLKQRGDAESGDLDDTGTDPTK